MMRLMWVPDSTQSWRATICGCRSLLRILISPYRFSLSFLFKRASSTDLMATRAPVTYNMMSAESVVMQEGTANRNAAAE
jgi:hypothetical protein